MEKIKKIHESIWKTIVYVVLSIWAATTIFPFLWLIANSFKPTTEILASSFTLPADPNFLNYINAFSKQNILSAYGNSILISGTTMVLVLLFASLTAFGLTRFEFRGKSIVNSLIIGSLMFPVFATIIPVFKMVVEWNLVNKHFGVIIPQVAANLSFAIIVLCGFMKSLPMEVEEAAFIDGAGLGKIYLNVILPLSKPALSSVSIFVFLWSYNDLFTQMIILRDRRMFPICALLNEISSKYGTDFGLMTASVVLVVAPVLVLYLIMQKNIVKGMTTGAVKG